MAIFGKKKLTLDEILEGVKNLSEDEKKALGEKMEDLYKAEDEREIDKIEEEKSDSEEVKDEKAEEVSEESEEIGKDVDEVEDEAETSKEAAEETAEKEVKEHESKDADWMASVDRRLDELFKMVKGASRDPRETEKTESDKLNELAKKFD